MDEPLQQEKQELDDKIPNEDQGGIRRRLRDRELLRKRRAEAEEKETNQEESQRKRSRGGQKSGARKRGRPRKTEPTVETAVMQDDTAVAQEPPAVVVMPEPSEVISDQTQSSLTPLFAMGGVTLESQPVPVAPAPVPELASLQSPDPAPTQSSPASAPAPAPAPVDPTPALVSPSVPVSVPAEVLETPPIPVQEPSAAPEAGLLPSLTEAPAPAAAPPTPSDPPQVKTFYTESQDREALDQVLIEDLGPDEEEDIYPSQDKSVDEDLSDKPLNGASEQNKIFSNPTLSSPPPPPPRQEYFPGNLF